MNKFLQLLGLAARARMIVSGEFAVEKAIKEQKVHLVIVTSDASYNTKKHFNDMCIYRDIPIVFASMKENLGKCTGKPERASIGVLDKGFAVRLASELREG